MGELREVRVVDNDALQRRIVETITHAQGADPLAPVTVVVDHADQAWALRRQLARQATTGAGLANVRATTLLELVAALANRLGQPSPAQGDPVLDAAVVEALLGATTGALAASADHPLTAVRLAGLSESLTWCPLEPTQVETLPPHGVSPTACTVIGFAGESRRAIAEVIGRPTWPQAAEAIRAALTAAPGALDLDLGTVVVACARVPAPIDDLLRALAEHLPVTRFAVSPDEAPITSHVFDLPDPDTETRFAVRLAAQAIDAGAEPGRVAVVYSADAPYARLLEHVLDDAGIAWHGPTGQTLQATTVARCLFALVDLAVARADGGSGLTRPRLMRLLGLGHLSAGPAPVAAAATRSLIRQEGLFGDARNWTAHLIALSESADVDPADSEPDEAAGPRHGSRLVRHAAPLTDLIGALDEAIGSIAAATTWTGLGSAIWAALESFHLHGTWWTIRPDDAAATAAIRALLHESIPAIDTLGAREPTVSAATAAQLLERSLAARRGRHGESSVGIHVGPVSSARGLVFDHLIVVGASEGLLPAIRTTDPLLPDVARTVLRRHRDDLPTSAEEESFTARDIRAAAAAAGTCTALLSRAGLPGRAVGLPSRYLPPAASDRIASARDSLTRTPHPMIAEEIAERTALTGGPVPTELDARLAGIAAWATPEPGPYFGLVAAAQAPWSPAGRTLSASAIEQFLHCPYHFLVQRILGFSTDEFEDTIDTIAPKDLGTLVHRAFELFVDQSRERGALPAPGAPWPASAIGDLRALVTAQLDEAQQKGLTGWSPSWDRSREILDAGLPPFLQVDAEQVRADPATTPVAVEQRFGDDDGPIVEFRVSADVVVRLRGAIDRVDLSATGDAVGIVDYKSGRSAGFADKLGKPKRDGTPRERQKVQDLVYDAAARALYPDAQHVGVHFVFVPNGGDDPVVVTPTHDEDRAAVLRELIGRIDAAARSGAFGPTPSGPRDYCPVCARLGRRAAIVQAKAAVDAPGAAS